MNPKMMCSDVLRIFEGFLRCFGSLWTPKSVIFGPKNPIFRPFLTVNVEPMAIKRYQTSSNTLKTVPTIQKMIYHDVLQVFELMLDIYRQLLATKSDFFDPKTPFFGPFLTINSGPWAAKMRETAVIWH